MDRRQAVRRLVAGGAAAAVSSSIVTSRAFADFGSPNCLPTNCSATPTVTTVSEGIIGLFNRIRVTVTAPGAATCPSGATPSIRYRYRVTRLAGTGGGGGARVLDCSTLAVLAAHTAWTGFLTSNSVCLYNSNSTLNLNNGTYQIDVIVRLVCTGPTKTCWCCVGRRRTVQLVGTTVTLVSDAALSVAAADCDVPAP